MKKLSLALALLLGVTPAIAQVNVVPQVGLVTSYLPKATYSAGFVGLVPPASATDTICIAGSASRVVKLGRILVNGTAGTLVTVPLALIRRATAATGGTPASTTANPANTITKRDTTTAAATATLVSYTAVPTITDSAGTIFAAQSVTLNITGTTAAPNAPAVFDFSNNQTLLAPPTLRGVAQQICVNFNTISVSSGVVNGSIEWSEE